ncbi:ubiquitin carboxyl-terminal hydrolase MINDY-1 isoform X3 [Punica granatum]|uniref:Ubiquitin carboxyl-terminal hydrolase MINDY-1 isoform X3 n=1 Tax=Punica granatum TaxID=22663 RepID=A0A6P8EFP2_PUNGR|nr:ubiquitin carboxyl-terminal hydrolase MINDY-1 isoform X3 [Punica granatum]
MAASASSHSSPPQSMEEQLRDEQQLHQQQQQQQHQTFPKEKECIHKTKLIQFLGRTTPIVLQNDNGPCPLLAICNILLLRNNLNLSPETTEVSQEKLLSLVAERLIDSNSNVNNKDAGYIENQQQNIADAIDLLPRLATGIDVNIKFRRIDDFEFTPECAIFDLLDIPLYHGWIVDPQDKDTAEAIANKSYNALTGELVALETQVFGKEHKSPAEEDCIDFAAATTAALGVPSPCLSKVRSFDDPSHPVADYHVARKGDLEEEAELLKALKLSEADVPDSVGPSPVVGNDEDDVSDSLVNNKYTGSGAHANIISEDRSCIEASSHKVEVSEQSVYKTLADQNGVVSSRDTVEEAVASSTSVGAGDHRDHSKQEKSKEALLGGDELSTKNVESLTEVGDASAVAKQHDSTDEIKNDPLKETEEVGNLQASPAFIVEAAENQGGGSTILSSMSASHTGEESILDSRPTHFEDREEPVYEGEVILARQSDKSPADDCGVGSTIDITPQQGELIRNFLKNNASQLTFYGLFCLQDGLKERELCVFFRNNHFSTMFKYEGELYLLATDQGYINQPDLVWEKLNEVNGDTLFMTGNFKEFNVENQSNGVWDEHNAVANTADYLASIDSATQAGLNVNSDLQLAIALQQQEFEQQQQQQRHGSQQASTGSSRLVTGPPVPRNNARYASSTSRPDAKSKDKCIIM